MGFAQTGIPINEDGVIKFPRILRHHQRGLVGFAVGRPYHKSLEGVLRIKITIGEIGRFDGFGFHGFFDVFEFDEFDFEIRFGGFFHHFIDHILIFRGKDLNGQTGIGHHDHLISANGVDVTPIEEGIIDQRIIHSIFYFKKDPIPERGDLADAFFHKCNRQESNISTGATHAKITKKRFIHNPGSKNAPQRPSNTFSTKS